MIAYYLVGKLGWDHRGRLSEITTRLKDGDGHEVEAWTVKQIETIRPMTHYEIGFGFDVRQIDKLYLEGKKHWRLSDALDYSIMANPMILRNRVIEAIHECKLVWDPEVIPVPLDIIDKKTERVRYEYTMLWSPRAWCIYDRERTMYYQNRAKNRVKLAERRPQNIYVKRDAIPPYDLFKTELIGLWVATDAFKNLWEDHGFTNLEFVAFENYC